MQKSFFSNVGKKFKLEKDRDRCSENKKKMKKKKFFDRK